MTEVAAADFTALTADIVSAYVGNNEVAATDLPTLISGVHEALRGATKPKVEAPPKREPAVSVKKSITEDYIISLIDGRKYKSLRRHLTTQGMTPDEYRAEFGLPKDYPLVAASYSAQRSALAKTLGLGQRRGAPDEVQAKKTYPEGADPAKVSGRKRKAA